MRKKIVGSSWKMHIDSIYKGEELAKEIRNLVGKIDEIDIFIIPTYPMIPVISKIFQGSCIKWGAQNVSYIEKGALTGEVPPLVLKELGCTYVEVGHAERRANLNETDETVNKKIKLIFKYGMIPIICIGETLSDLNNNYGKLRLETQILWALDGLNKDEIEKVVIAYEPVWAIGQSEAAKEDYVEEVHSFIRSVITDRYGEEVGQAVRIIYGGSVSPESAQKLCLKENVDGVFIGRFGLKAENFEKMVCAFK
ncbi:triose-phosphate isomerase [Fonticella tunisiensis]|uniref:Triosephosphate isomerase n=1 Tax=Fonticella tunisiensis TaxID=1096341 RepID=A0A4R7KB96_9CLOT|nr:triose-phosphate isomerase [Fonticella tunisiensis]TDT50350.1 triosephosphate isomerase [Fonticella tunisiensis]